jgi:hypothetical protein
VGDEEVTTTIGQVQSAYPEGRPRKLPRRFASILAGVALFMVTAAVTAVALVPKEPQIVGDLQTTLAQILPEGRCVTAREAVDTIRGTLDDTGRQDWVISSSGVQAGGCVGAGISASDKRIVLTPAARPEVAKALQGVAQQLMSQCLGRQEATQLLDSVLTGLGEEHSEIRSDGPLLAPIAEKDTVLRHVASGCYVYSSMGWSPDGLPMYFISGQ